MGRGHHHVGAVGQDGAPVEGGRRSDAHGVRRQQQQLAGGGQARRRHAGAAADVHGPHRAAGEQPGRCAVCRGSRPGAPAPAAGGRRAHRSRRRAGRDQRDAADRRRAPAERAGVGRAARRLRTVLRADAVGRRRVQPVRGADRHALRGGRRHAARSAPDVPVRDRAAPRRRAQHDVERRVHPAPAAQAVPAGRRARPAGHARADRDPDAACRRPFTDWEDAAGTTQTSGGISA